MVAFFFKENGLFNLQNNLAGRQKKAKVSRPECGGIGRRPCLLGMLGWRDDLGLVAQIPERLLNKISRSDIGSCKVIGRHIVIEHFKKFPNSKNKLKFTQSNDRFLFIGYDQIEGRNSIRNVLIWIPELRKGLDYKCCSVNGQSVSILIFNSTE